GSAAFYLAIRHEVYANADEALLNRKNAIIRTLEEKDFEIDKEFLDYTDFRLWEIDRVTFNKIEPSYADTLIYEPTDDEWDDYRRLISKFSHKGSYYKIAIVKPQLENDEIITAMAIGLGSLGILMIVALIAGTPWLSQKLWKPFEQTLQALQNFRLDQHRSLDLPEEKIEEFDRLNRILNKMSAKNLEVYLQQKRFIENASHEIQTPLAIIRSKLELLIQQPQLSDKSAQQIDAIASAVERLSKLNRTLLLLVKIENKQYLAVEEVEVSKLVAEILDQTADQYEMKNIQISALSLQPVKIKANPSLLEILFTNLIKNAFVHNTENGFINVHLSPEYFVIVNSGSALQMPPEKLFERFSKNNSNPNHIGLGLALVKQICQTYHFTIAYKYADCRHTLILKF
ncbi:MAG: HAMP domain-containing histidine kinase, partial [Bacteroidetes bacterium]|nr:HAMP domain-containing histidine kinase [Bacteroidota bacterium]